MPPPAQDGTGEAFPGPSPRPSLREAIERSEEIRVRNKGRPSQEDLDLLRELASPGSEASEPLVFWGPATLFVSPGETQFLRTNADVLNYAPPPLRVRLKIVWAWITGTTVSLPTTTPTEEA